MATPKVFMKGSSSLTVSHAQMAEVHRQLGCGDLNARHIQALIRHENPFSLEALEIDWREVYEKLGMSLEQEIIWDNQHWVVPVEKGVTMDMVTKVFQRLGVPIFVLYTGSLDMNVTTNDRDPSNGSYVVRFGKTIEADHEFSGKSADVLAKENIKGITLLERLLLELGYYMTTNLFLDLNNWTLCSGSRDSGGFVPNVHWNSICRVASVGAGVPSHSASNLRTRAVRAVIA